ncbi:hypothetical protein [Roseisalinus antarcticus]|uniref:Clp protease n=1 Tax=Roseisalinus antarcticus TaxID=254357 RepID=A0A1Y5RKM0_9RHOB|nr:hypothetical protein [Roseisalinus antarcticus]SLN19497.1 hypothetical protein ROA7023_00457 [Roseisalinus antarcticus]
MSVLRPHPGTRGAIRAILWLQVGLAVVLLGSELIRVLPQIVWPSAAPELTAPLAPGDQTRRYRPAELPARDAPPGSRPVPVTTDMPSRLLFEPATWEGRETLTLTGTIAPGDAERLSDYLDGRTAPELVFLNSPGGSVGDALSIGRSLREMEAETRMSQADICLSACPYMLAAGVRRQVAEGAMVGVHQHFFGENIALPAFLAVEDIQRGQGEVMAYLAEMGIDPLLMQPALVTPPDEIYLLTAEELSRYGLVTPADGAEPDT